MMQPLGVHNARAGSATRRQDITVMTVSVMFCKRVGYLEALFAFAQRFFCAAAILARASAERRCFFGADGALPLVVEPESRALTC